MATPLPSADKAFGPDKSNSLPTADQAFGPDGEQTQSGSFADHFWSSEPSNRILDAFGQGAKQSWGTETLGLSEQTEKELVKAGVFNDYQNNKTNILKSANEAIIRPVAAGLDAVMRSFSAFFGGADTGLTQAAEEIGGPVAAITGSRIDGQVVGFPFAALGELAGGIHDGWIPEGLPAGLAKVPEARANAVIGEGESGYFGTSSITPEQGIARNEATGRLAIQGNTTPDIHTVARQIAPDVFDKYDDLTSQKDLLENSINELRKDRINDPDAQAAKGQIDSILDTVNGNEEELTEAKADELSKARDDLDEVLNKSTPEIDELREHSKAVYDKIVDLSPDIRYAYREAQETSGTESVPPSGTPTEPVQGVSDESSTQVPQSEEASVEGSKGLSGEIASDVSEKLQKAGRPVEESDAVGQLIESHYNARADRLGLDAKTLYDRDFPDVVQGGKAEVGRTLNQAGLVVARKTPEGVVYGKPGELHFDLYKDPMEYNTADLKQDGFAEGEGKPFMSRDEALDWVTKNEPKIKEGMRNEKGGSRVLYDHGLESVLYNKVKSAISDGSRSVFSRIFGQDRRGSITLRQGRNLIRLFKDADASTFIHETGHQWLEELLKDASHDDAPEELKQDLRSVRTYLNNDGGVITRAQHEKFARTFERYLREGVAPSRGLVRVFEKFKAWLSTIYKKVGQLHAPINDDIRKVFDRLIVSEPQKTVIARDREVRTPETSSETGPSVSRTESPQGEPSGTSEQPVASPASQDSTTPPPPEATASSGSLGPAGPSLGGSVTSDEPVVPSRPVVPQAEPSAEPVGSVPNTPKDIPSANESFKDKTTPLVDKAGNIRVDLLDTKEALTQIIKDVAEQNKDFLASRNNNITSQDMIELAESAGVKNTDINMEALEALTAEDGIPIASRIYGLRQALIQSANAVWELTRGDDEIAYVQGVTRLLNVQKYLSQVTAEWGRAGLGFKSMAEQAKNAQELSEFFQNNLGKSLEQVKSDMEKTKHLNDPSQVAGFSKDVQKASLGEMGLEIFRNYLISGPITHMTYAAGNKLFALYKAFPETLARAAVGAIHEAVVGHPIERVYAGEAGEGLYAMLYGQRDGLRAAWESLKAGQTLPLPGEDVASTPFTRSRAVPGLLGSVVRAPGERMVAPIHSFDRTVGYLTNRAQLIYRQAKSEGLDGDGLSQRIAELEKNTPDEITKGAVSEATSQSLMDRPGETTRKFLNLIRSEINLPVLGRTQPGSFLAPFVTVVSNINKQGILDRGPLGVFSKSVRDDIFGKNGVFAQDTAIAKMGLGVAVVGTVAGLTIQGIMNGRASSNYHQAVIDQRVEGLPNSIRIGDMTYEYNKLGIPGVMMSMASDLTTASMIVSKNPEHAEAYEAGASYMIHSLGQMFLQEGMMSGVSDMLNAVEDSDRYGPSYVRNMLSTAVVPFSVGASQIAHLTDPYQREVHTNYQAILNKIPGKSEDLQPKIDVWGQPIPNKEYWGVYAQQVENDPVDQALKSSGYYPAPVERKIRGISLTDGEYHDYAVKSGTIARMMVEPIINMPQFGQLSATTRHDMIQNAIRSARSSAADSVMMQSMQDNPEDNIVTKALALKQGLATGIPK